MKAYKYMIPESVRFEGAKYVEPALRFGQKEIIAKDKVDKFRDYFVSEIEVPDSYFGEEESVNPVTVYTEDSLSSKKYKEVQKIAKSMGLEYKGKKAEIIKRILDANRV